jgi:hypothetical protein
MNVLILTPDRVGSTLLQRLITIYMTAHEYNKPVINLHELTNGLMKYYSPVFNKEVLGKPNDGRPWGYYQSLPEITTMLAEADHYVTSRLAHYHIVNRQDSIQDQVPFYQFLNDNYYIISAQRDNIFEHALSWCIYTDSKKLNVYSHSEKLNVFGELYKNKITIEPGKMINYLFKYKDYLKWVNDHFHVSSYFYYDRDMSRIEDYILGLGIFNSQPKKKTWNDIFQIEFDSWNKCHYLLSDLSGIGKQLTDLPRLSYEANANYQLQSLNADTIVNSLTVPDQKFLIQSGPAYKQVASAIQELVDHKVLVTPVPIKLQTLLEKRLLIQNFDECVSVYNEWMQDEHSKINGLGPSISYDDIDQQTQAEIQHWHNLPKLQN